LPYASMVFEMAEDGSPIYGVEVDVPFVGNVAPCHSFFLLGTQGWVLGP